MKEICDWFACVYAMKDGCTIQGYMSEAGGLNGTKEHCPHYDEMCIGAKCSRCGHGGDEVCKKYMEEGVNNDKTNTRGTVHQAIKYD